MGMRKGVAPSCNCAEASRFAVQVINLLRGTETAETRLSEKAWLV
jgi:hypothetical protein